MKMPIGSTSGKLGHARRVEVEGEAAKPDQQDEADQEIVVGAALFARTEQEEREPGKRGEQKGAVACGVHGLGKQRLARPTLAIEEDMLAQCHGRYPFNSIGAPSFGNAIGLTPNPDAS